ncbi:MAG TPA: tetratricopeptide repeat protein [Gemmatimonadaceae bacterium]|nr:tetratricopeptide repeat protein [Gemmatimonadaceae bacterium]
MLTVYEVGAFRLDPLAGVLTRSGVPQSLGSRAVGVLAVLVRNAHSYVEKNAILDAAWPGVVVEEGNLTVQISAIRRVLAQVPGGDRWVETIARRGYRFVGPVKEVTLDENRKSAGWSKRSNLPEPLTSFIGRERQLAEIKRLLPKTRLLTIVGVGGIGKTRLALQLAAEVSEAYRDGVCFVELAPLADPSLVPNAAAQVLGVRDVRGKSLTEALSVHVRNRQLLLLLDNCEHVLDAGAMLVDAMLTKAADLTVIATSREPLRVSGEQVYRLSPFTLPDAAASAEAMAQSEAVQLFVERARYRRPDFELTQGNARAVGNVCTRLDGIPLALELAAARVHALSIEQINERLDDRFKLLTDGSRAALPRQQTLHATLDWSHGLLSRREQIVLRRLAVFLGGFSLDAASFVASDIALRGSEVTDLLSRLVARSLVEAEIGNMGAARYRLLETTRGYAAERLAEAGETDDIRRRHAQYLCDLFNLAPENWLRMPDMDWRALYAKELDNVRTALDWALSVTGDPSLGVALAGASGPMWLELSLHGEGRGRLEAAMERVGPTTSRLDQARIALWLGMLFGEAEPIAAGAAKTRAVELYREIADATGLGFSLVQLAAASVSSGRFERAAQSLAEAWPLLENARLPKPLARYFDTAGFLLRQTGDPVRAREHFERALKLFRNAGAEREALRMLGNLADLTWSLGDLDASVAAFRESVSRLRNSPLTTANMLGFNLANLAGVLTEKGDLAEALAAAREGMPLLTSTGNGWIHADHLALRAALVDKFDVAARIAGYADSQYASKQAPRHPNEARARTRLFALLRAHFKNGEVDNLLAEGAVLNDDEACRFALED